MQQQHDLVAVTLVIDMVVNIVDQYFLAGRLIGLSPYYSADK